MLYPYPTEFPLEDVLAVIQALRGGTTPSAALVAKHVWVLTGYFLRITVKEPVDAIYLEQSVVDTEYIPGAPKTTIGDKEDAAALLESMVLIHKSEGVYVESSLIGTAVTIGGSYVLTQLAKMILPYLLKWLVEYLFAEIVEKDRPVLDAILPDRPLLKPDGFVAQVKEMLEKRKEERKED